MALAAETQRAMPPLKKTVALEKPPMVPVEDQESQISVVETPRKEGGGLLKSDRAPRSR